MNFPLAPQQASSIAYEHDVVFYALLALTIIFTIIVMGMVVFFAVRYRRGARVDRSPGIPREHEAVPPLNPISDEPY